MVSLAVLLVEVSSDHHHWAHSDRQKTSLAALFCSPRLIGAKGHRCRGLAGGHATTRGRRCLTCSKQFRGGLLGMQRTDLHIQLMTCKSWSLGRRGLAGSFTGCAASRSLLGPPPLSTFRHSKGSPSTPIGPNGQRRRGFSCGHATARRRRCLR